MTSTYGGAAVVSTEGLPRWLLPVARAAETIEPRQLSRFLPPETGGRQSAVLVLFGDGDADGGGDGAGHAAWNAVGGGGEKGGAGDRGGGRTDHDRSAGGESARGPVLLLTERAGSLRSHAGQPSFPGGSLDPEDGDPDGAGPLRAALREAREETGLDPSGVQLFGVLPRLYIPVSGFVVTPVLGWWREPSPVMPVDPRETARVFTVPVADLTDPANRATTVHPSGHRGPSFHVADTLVWGFTASVIDRILHYAGWELPWDREKRVPLDGRA
ncbi:CoA pyrophosphatase [Streptomyces varsoviensis]|uniref:NUDIX hydrolase n=1 Tax=Streptomyces varsoviensis TaxID=67373 RepID=UPI0033DE18C2